MINQRGFSCIGLHHPKTSMNIGGVLRAASAYESAMVAVSGHRYKRHPTDTNKTYRHLPFLQVDDLQRIIPFDCIPVAVDLLEGATPLPEYKHPERAFYIFGPEDGTLGESVLSWCRDKVFIPTKYCMNLAACVNVVLYDRLAKSQNHQGG